MSDSDLSPTEGSASARGKEHEPIDRRHVVWWSTMAFGAGFLFPYNTFITALDFYAVTYREYHPEFVIPALYTAVTLAIIILNVFFGVTKFSLHARIRFGFVVFLLSMVWVPIFEAAYAAGMVSQGVSYAALLAAVVAVGVGGGVQQSSMYGYAGMMGYALPVMIGESMAGLLVSVNRIVTKGAFAGQSDSRSSTYVFYAMSITFLALCAVLYEYVHRTPFSRYYTTKFAVVTKAQTVEMQNLVTDEDDVDDADDLVVRDDRTGPPSSSPSSWDLVRKVSRTCPHYLMAVFLTYLVTLAVFPGAATKVQSHALKDWMPVIMIAIFNLFDFIGKIVPLQAAHRGLRWQPTTLHRMSWARLLILPPLLIAALSSSQSGFIDSLGFLSMIALGLTNGYLGAVLMSQATNDAAHAEKEMTGNVMTLALLTGLSLGAIGAMITDFAAS